MSRINCFIYLGCLITASVLANVIVEPDCQGKCPFAYKCSPYYSAELVWALVDGHCEVFANDCMLGSYNCNRINECKSEIVKSTQEECQQCCASCNCEQTPQVPHYATFYDLSKNFTSTTKGYCKDFSSKCAALKWACENARPIDTPQQGKCPA